MAKLDDALARLSAALTAAEAAPRRGEAPDDGGAARRIEQLEAEREGLLARIAELEEQAAEDARLRAEAAEAVKAALGDLRAVAQAGGGRQHG